VNLKILPHSTDHSTYKNLQVRGLYENFWFPSCSLQIQP